MAKVNIKDGPHKGKSYNYTHPVPENIVIPEVSSQSMKYHDYVKTKAHVNHFQHSDRCRCHSAIEIKDLDV